MDPTLVIRIPIVDATSPKSLDERIRELCDVELAADYILVSTFIASPDTITAIFQRLVRAS